MNEVCELKTEIARLRNALAQQSPATVEGEIKAAATDAACALRYLAENTRPSGGEETFNSLHLHSIADWIERALNQRLAGKADDKPAMVLFAYATGPQLDKLVPPAIGKTLTDAVALYAKADFTEFEAQQLATLSPTKQDGQKG